MSSPACQKRIITCQGTIQLITALSVMAYRAKEENSPLSAFENHLVIYDLYAPAEQINDFVSLIKQIATSLVNWKTIAYITPEQLTAIAKKLHNTSESDIFKIVYDLVGTSDAAEIYLCRNWQFGNNLLINAYKKAHKVCYGDSIGIHFSANSSAFFAAQTSPMFFSKEKFIYATITTPKQWLKMQKDRIQSWLGLKTTLKTVNFDQGYFTLPNFMGKVPPMEHKKIASRYILSTVTSLEDLVSSDYVDYIHKEIGNSPVAILLTSNFSEAGRMSYDNELTAYLRFLSTTDLVPDSVLLIKPHPRDSFKKIQQLQAQLADLFSNIIILAEPQLFFLPFEIFFQKVFSCPQLSADYKIESVQIFAVSSACLGLKLLFDVSSTVGFGPAITPNLFYKSYVDGRLAHEHDLTAAIQSIESRTKTVDALP